MIFKSWQIQWALDGGDLTPPGGWWGLLLLALISGAGITPHPHTHLIPCGTHLVSDPGCCTAATRVHIWFCHELFLEQVQDCLSWLPEWIGSSTWSCSDGMMKCTPKLNFHRSSLTFEVKVYYYWGVLYYTIHPWWVMLLTAEVQYGDLETTAAPRRRDAVEVLLLSLLTTAPTLTRLLPPATTQQQLFMQLMRAWRGL